MSESGREKSLHKKAAAIVERANENVIGDPVEWLSEAFHAIRKRATEQHDWDLPYVRWSLGFTEAGKNQNSKMRIQIVFPEATVGGQFEGIVQWREGFDHDVLEQMILSVPQIMNGTPDRNQKCRDKANQWGLVIGDGGLRAAKPGKPLRDFLTALEDRLGPFPHLGIKFDVLNEKRHKVMTGAKAPQKGRMHKVACDRCGLIVRQSRGSIDEYGPAVCPRHKAAMTVHYKEGEEPDAVGEAEAAAPDAVVEPEPTQEIAAPVSSEVPEPVKSTKHREAAE